MSAGTNRERIEQNNLKLEEIKTQIQSLPEAGGTVEGIKQFATIEQMQADTTAKEGDLAVVYRSEIQNATVDSRFQIATFSDTVVLDTALTDYVEVRYRAVDSSKMFDCWGDLDSSRFSMDCYTDSGPIRIQYTSSDGITYTRTDTTGNPVDFGTEIYYEMPERWNDAIGKFIQTGGNIFEGLYDYELNVATDNISLHSANVSDWDMRDESSTLAPEYIGEISYTGNDAFNKISKTIKHNDLSGLLLLTADMKTGYMLRKYYSHGGYSTSNRITFRGGRLLVLFSSNTGEIVKSYNLITIDLENNTYSMEDITSQAIDVNIDICTKAITMPSDIFYIVGDVINNTNEGLRATDETWVYRDTSTSYVTTFTWEKKLEDTYTYAPTQLTLTEANQLYPGKTALGKKGVIESDGTIWNSIPNNTIRYSIYNWVDETNTRINPYRYSYFNGRKQIGNKIVPLNISDIPTEEIVWYDKILKTFDFDSSPIIENSYFTNKQCLWFMEDDTYYYHVIQVQYNNDKKFSVLKIHKITLDIECHVFTMPYGVYCSSDYYQYAPILIYDNKMYTGGYNYSDGGCRLMWYDFNTKTTGYTSIASLYSTYSSAGDTFIRLYNGNIYMYFCYTNKSSVFKMDTFVYNVSSRSWSRTASNTLSYNLVLGNSYMSNDYRYISSRSYKDSNIYWVITDLNTMTQYATVMFENTSSWSTIRRDLFNNSIIQALKSQTVENGEYVYNTITFDITNKTFSTNTSSNVPTDVFMLNNKLCSVYKNALYELDDNFNLSNVLLDYFKTPANYYINNSQIQYSLYRIISADLSSTVPKFIFLSNNNGARTHYNLTETSLYYVNSSSSIDVLSKADMYMTITGESYTDILPAKIQTLSTEEYDTALDTANEILG